MTKFLIKLLITVAFIAIIIWELGDLKEVGKLLVEADFLYLALMLAVVLGDRALMTFKWGILLRAQNVWLPFLRGLKFYCIGSAWSQLLPSMGGDVVRAYMAARSGLNTTKIITSIIIERVFGFMTSLVFGLAGLLILNRLVDLDSQLPNLWLVVALVISAAIMVFGFSFNQKVFDLAYRHTPRFLAGSRIIKSLQKVHETYVTYSKHKRALGIFFFLTLIKQLAPIAIYWLGSIALGLDIDLVFMAGVVSLAMPLMRLPISIGGFGVLEGAFVVLMSLAHVSAAEAVSIALISRIVIIAASLPWWFVYVHETKEFSKPKYASLDDVRHFGDPREPNLRSTGTAGSTEVSPDIHSDICRDEEKS